MDQEENPLARRQFFVREHAGLLKAAYDYDILDPATRRLIMECREDRLPFWTRLFRYSDFRRTTPFDMRVRTPAGRRVVRLKRGVPISVSKVRVLDEQDRLIGSFSQKAFSVCGAFDVLDAQDQPVCRLRGRMTGWDFRFRAEDGVELARVTKKWAGFGKELLTSADDYLLSIDDVVPPDSTLRRLILASVLCIGTVVKGELP